VVQKLNIPSVASIPVREGDYRTPELTLGLENYNANGASISCSGDGVTFAFTIWPLSDATVNALERVAQTRGRIYLSCCRVPVLFDLVVVERREPRKARIVGRIVGGVSYAKGDTAA